MRKAKWIIENYNVYCSNCENWAAEHQNEEGEYEYYHSRFCPYCGSEMENAKET